VGPDRRKQASEATPKGSGVVGVANSDKEPIGDDRHNMNAESASSTSTTEARDNVRPTTGSPPGTNASSVRELINRFTGLRDHSGPGPSSQITRTPTAADRRESLSAPLGEKVSDERRTGCSHCGQRFASYKLVRQHESRSHPLEYRRELEAKLPLPESELMAKIAKIEAGSKRGGKFYSEMVRATGLTEHQVRHRREQKIYQRYLTEARAQVRRSATKLFGLPTSSTPVTQGQSTPGGGLTKTDICSSSPHQAIKATESPQIAPPDIGFTRPPKRTREDLNSDHISAAHEVEPIQPPPNLRGRGLDSIMAEVSDVPSTKRGRSVSSTPSPKNKRVCAGELIGVDTDIRGRNELDFVSSLNITLRGSSVGNITCTPLNETILINKPSVSREVEPPSTPMRAALLPGSFVAYLTALNDLDRDTQGMINRALMGTGPELLAAMDDWIQQRFPAKVKTARGCAAAVEGPPLSKRALRISRYKNCQDLFVKSKKTLADMILSGKDVCQSVAAPTLADTETLYGGLLESESPVDPDPFIERDRCSDTFKPITETEVVGSMGSWKVSAPGPDGTSVEDVKRCGARALSVLCTLVLGSRIAPSRFLQNRTILIHKDGDGSDPTNWRPITVGSSIQRLFHRVMASRLVTATNLNSNQRGFVRVDGTLLNGVILDHYMRSRRAQGKGYNVVSLDVRKAFDTVSHWSIRRALLRHGIEVETIDYIIKSLGSSVTRISVGHETSRHLGITCFRTSIPGSLAKRIRKSLESSGSPVETLTNDLVFSRNLQRLERLAPLTDPGTTRREQIRMNPYVRGIEEAVHDVASRSWIDHPPLGWTGRDYVRAIQLRNGNLPTRGIPSNPPEHRRCRAGCTVNESLCHVLQACPLTHGVRIARHNEICAKLADHCRRRGWVVEEEPHVRHMDGRLYKPDLAIRTGPDRLTVCDVQVSWSGDRGLDQAWTDKQLKYDNEHFRAAALRKWPNTNFTILPLVLGARGTWAGKNLTTTCVLGVTAALKRSCVHSCLKWGSSIHATFMRTAWAQRTAQHNRNQQRNHQPALVEAAWTQRPGGAAQLRRHRGRRGRPPENGEV
ncbi:PREDICTED: uncharacterized protein LOC108557038, partial [Nicrophorus vespilloides]|uniref:Uncharacterized protein LOC108557038 n=1 Tax=Nicrophorus vespilloides TaxID=110193 RepID=A0ABM1M2V2_NICVS